MSDFDENDCCGNGCANCVLDIKPPLREKKLEFSQINVIKNYTNFTLQSKTQINDLKEVVKLHFRTALDSKEKSKFTLFVPSGQHIMMRANTNGKRLLRPYSPFWVNKDKLEFKLLVNLSPNGLMSKYICSLVAGDQVEFRGPIGGHYSVNSNENFQSLILISQGVAIAPTLPIVNEILENEDDMTRIFQFACFTDLKHAYFRKNLQEFNKFWNYAGFLYLSRQICNDVECLRNNSCISDCKNLAKQLLYKEKAFAKRFSGLELQKIVGKDVLSKVIFVISGSRLFQNQISNELKELGLDICDKNVFLL